MRVTGSMTISLSIRLGSEPGFGGKVWQPSGYEFGQNEINSWSRWRTSRDKNVYFDKFVDGPGIWQQRWNNLARYLLIELGVFEIGAVGHRFRSEPVTHAGNVRGHGTVAKRNHRFGALANGTNSGQIVVGTNSAFYQDNVYVLRVLFGVDQRAVDQVRELRHFD